MLDVARLGAPALVVAAFFGGWTVNGWRLDARGADAAQAATVALQTSVRQREALALKLSQANDAALSELQGAQSETNKLRDCLRAGTCGLRVAAQCPEATAASAGLDIGAAAELTPNAGRAYFALRDGIDRASSQLSACQALIRPLVDEAH